MVETFFTQLRQFHAPWWKMLLARLLGRRIVAADPPTGVVMTSYLWRGTLYVHRLRRPLPDKTDGEQT